jgi:two-component system, LytTR family, sensor kinase
MTNKQKTPGFQQPLLTLSRYLIFWAVSFFVIARFFSPEGSLSEPDLIYSLLFHLSILFGVLINSFILIPRFLAPRRFLLYIPLVLLLIELCVRLNQLTFNELAGTLLPQYQFISFYDRLELYIFMIAYLGITSLMQFSRTWFREAEFRRKLEIAENEMPRQELKMLQAMIQPHLLFNTLNTVHELSAKQSRDASVAIQKLSELSGYAIRQTGVLEVPLDNEIQYIRDYISLQKMRLSDPDMVSFTVRGRTSDLKIAPMILIIFVENIFMHADFEQGYPASIHLICDDDHILFRCSNRIPPYKTDHDTGHGTGIENARRRLELTYPDSHQIEIYSNNREFNLDLSINPDSRDEPGYH